MTEYSEQRDEYSDREETPGEAFAKIGIEHATEDRKRMIRRYQDRP